MVFYGTGNKCLLTCIAGIYTLQVDTRLSQPVPYPEDAHSGEKMFTCFLGSGKNYRNEKKPHCSSFESFPIRWENHLSDLWLKRPLYQQQDLVEFLSFAQITMTGLEIETGQHQPTGWSQIPLGMFTLSWLCSLLYLFLKTSLCSRDSFAWPFPVLSVSRTVFLPLQ